MIEINLLPDELKKKEERFKKADLSGLTIQKIPILSLIASVFGVLIAFQAVLFFIGICCKMSFGALDKKYNELLPKKQEADALKSQVETMNKKMKAIDELMVKRFSWAKKLNSLSDSMTPGIWLTELAYDEKSIEKPLPAIAKSSNKEKGPKGSLRPTIEKAVLKYLVISGFASSMGEEGTASIGKFIKSLKENNSFYEDFSDIELGTIKTDKIEEQEVMSFKVTCLFKE